jgi:hypothetical protein
MKILSNIYSKGTFAKKRISKRHCEITDFCLLVLAQTFPKAGLADMPHLAKIFKSGFITHMVFSALYFIDDLVDLRFMFFRNYHKYPFQIRRMSAYFSVIKFALQTAVRTEYFISTRCPHVCVKKRPVI